MKSHINHPLASPETIDRLIKSLSSNDPAERNDAKNHLIQIGEPAVQALIKLTVQPDSELRRETASILGNIHDPSAIPALINLLIDERFEVRWRAAESLVKMKRDVVFPLFQELLRKDRFDSVWFLEGAHHILRKLDNEGYLEPLWRKVLEAFDDPMKEIKIPEAAERALETLENPQSTA